MASLLASWAECQPKQESVLSASASTASLLLASSQSVDGLIHGKVIIKVVFYC